MNVHKGLILFKKRNKDFTSRSFGRRVASSNRRVRGHHKKGWNSYRKSKKRPITHQEGDISRKFYYSISSSYNSPFPINRDVDLRAKSVQLSYDRSRIGTPASNTIDLLALRAKSMDTKSLEIQKKIQQDAEHIEGEKKVSRQLVKNLMSLTDSYPHRYTLRRKITDSSNRAFSNKRRSESFNEAKLEEKEKAVYLVEKREHLKAVLKKELMMLKKGERKYKSLHNELISMKRERDFVFKKHKKLCEKEHNLLRKIESLRMTEKDYKARIDAGKLNEGF